MEMTSSEKADLLERAANLIEVRGHCKGIYEEDNGNLCALGALNHATGDPYHWHYPREIIALILNKVVPLGYVCISGWNDDPKRTAAEVIDMFRLTAKDLRNES